MYYHHSHELRNFPISFILNVAGDLPDLQAPPQPCSIKFKYSIAIALYLENGSKEYFTATFSFSRRCL